MTTKSHNPVNGDVQAHQMPELTQRARQAVIEFCVARIAHLERCIKAYPGHPAIKIDLLVQQVALAALTAESVAQTSDSFMRELKINKSVNCWIVAPDSDPGFTVPLYTTPPAQLLRPVELPKRKSMLTREEIDEDYKTCMAVPIDEVIAALEAAGVPHEVKND